MDEREILAVVTQCLLPTGTHHSYTIYSILIPYRQGGGGEGEVGG